MRARHRDGSAFVGGLLELPSLPEGDRALALRQALAELARSAADEGPSPLEGLPPEALGAAVRVALEGKLLDDLEWLASGRAGSALYSLAAALPPGPEQRELGRRVLARLLTADAESFSVTAATMAQAGGKGLSTPSVVARIALLTELPHLEGVPSGPLSLAIASRRELARFYLREPSTRSLPERRLSVRLLERAAREAAHRATHGDRSASRLLSSEGTLSDVMLRLLADREPLVWRHAAIARGLVAPFVDGGIDALERELGDDYSITEWRRAVASLGGLAAVEPAVALELATRATSQGLFERDPGAAASLVWGLARTAESEPEAAEQLFELAEGHAVSEVAEAVVWLGRELGRCPFVERVRARAASALRQLPTPTNGQAVVNRELEVDLSASAESTTRLWSRLDEAVLLFAREGAAAARTAGLALLSGLEQTVSTLEAQTAETAGSTGREGFGALRDLDLTLFERATLSALLHLDPKAERVQAGEGSLESARQRTLAVLLAREQVPDHPGDGSTLPIRMASLRTLLHLVDSDPSLDEDSVDARRRWQTTAQALAAILERKPHASLHRALMATFARSLDALVRIRACDVADVLLVTSVTLAEPRQIDTLAEASMDPDVRCLLWRLAALVRAHRGELPLPPTSSNDPTEALRRREDARRAAERSAFDALADELGAVGTARADVLHNLMLKLERALDVVDSAASLRALTGDSRDALSVVSLENTVASIGQLVLGARARVLNDAPPDVRPRASRALSSAVQWLLDDGVPTLSDDDVEQLVTPVVVGLPTPMDAMVGSSARRLLRRPRDTAHPAPTAVETAPGEQLPVWIPARRTLGAYYVQRQLGVGAAGSVFVVTRTEDRHAPDAERFALKVPDYNAGAARHLSETEFLAMFKGEASALMALPAHPNLARFVTFDLAARPKPILVMELVEGSDLEHLIDGGTLDTPLALRILAQVLDGLGAMHEVGVGHLDLKPSNVILRSDGTPVLVDFGLAGRAIRPGCGSPPYAAPEVWGLGPSGHVPQPPPADVYAFACLAYEALTGQLLFDGETEAQVLASHLTHDGLPERLRAFSHDAKLAPLAELLFACLRRDPTQRILVRELIREWPRVTAKLGELRWPIEQTAP